MEKLKPKSQKLSAAMRGKKNSMTHGHTEGRKYSPTYVSWQSMLARMRYKRHNSHHYVSVKVCERWQDFESFLADMGERPEGKTLDRFPNNDGNYEPGNCRWATPIEQARNRRNARLTFDDAVEVALARLAGEPCKSIADRFGCSESLPREIVKGRSWKDALKEAWNRRHTAAREGV